MATGRGSWLFDCGPPIFRKMHIWQKVNGVSKVKITWDYLFFKKNKSIRKLLILEMNVNKYIMVEKNCRNIFEWAKWGALQNHLQQSVKNMMVILKAAIEVWICWSIYINCHPKLTWHKKTCSFLKDKWAENPAL